MRPLIALNRWRDTASERSIYGNHPPTIGDLNVGGVFQMESASAPGVMLRVIASNGMGWDHVSVSTAGRCPTWEEMEQIKRAFFRPNEAAMQLHVPPADHINVHPYCLHIWRPHGVEIPLPPSIMVGVAA